jgi:hypothetical protein
MDPQAKIDYKLVQMCDVDIFGDWINSLDKLHDDFVNAEPFEHVVIDNFLKEEYAEKVAEQFPTNLDNYYKYCNPILFKYLNDNVGKMDDCIKNLFYALSSDKIVGKMSELTGIKDLEYDKYLHGAGLHMSPRYGRLNLHLDYEKHPIFENRERRLNIIIYLNKEWEFGWNGQTELWDSDGGNGVTNCIKKIDVKFNRALIFRTNELSWHGVPEKIFCPEGEFRKTLAFYYIAPLQSIPDKNKLGVNEEGYRVKAAFVKRPQDKYDERMEKLYKIRPYRRITQDDMDEIWDDWDYVKD